MDLLPAEPQYIYLESQEGLAISVTAQSGSLLHSPLETSDVSAITNVYWTVVPLQGNVYGAPSLTQDVSQRTAATVNILGSGWVPGSQVQFKWPNMNPDGGIPVARVDLGGNFPSTVLEVSVPQGGSVTVTVTPTDPNYTSPGGGSFTKELSAQSIVYPYSA